MNLFRTLSGAAVALFIGAGMTSCLQAPDYPITPEIDFKELRVNYTPRGTQDAINELTFVLNFRDGDGDLGLSDDDIHQPPYNQPPPPSVPRRNHLTSEYNYLIQPYIKNAMGRFEAFMNPPPLVKIGEYDATFVRLDGVNARSGPMRGELNYRLPISIDGVTFKTGQVFRFEITIIDRALHVSNTITTSEVTLR